MNQVTAKPGSLRTLVRNLRTRDEWRRGYFCAVANLIKMDGLQTTGRALFAAGGDWQYADAEDIEVFREVGLIPDAGTKASAAPCEKSSSNEP